MRPLKQKTGATCDCVAANTSRNRKYPVMMASKEPGDAGTTGTRRSNYYDGMSTSPTHRPTAAVAIPIPSHPAHRPSLISVPISGTQSHGSRCGIRTTDGRTEANQHMPAAVARRPTADSSGRQVVGARHVVVLSRLPTLVRRSLGPSRRIVLYVAVRKVDFRHL